MENADQQRAAADFTLRGKVALVNIRATWCQPCRKEMPDMDALYREKKGKGPVLLDAGSGATTSFAVDGIPKSFVFDRTGKLVAQSMDMRTRGQFEAMLKKAGL